MLSSLTDTSHSVQSWKGYAGDVTGYLQNVTKVGHCFHRPNNQYGNPGPMEVIFLSVYMVSCHAQRLASFGSITVKVYKVLKSSCLFTFVSSKLVNNLHLTLLKTMTNSRRQTCSVQWVRGLRWKLREVSSQVHAPEQAVVKLVGWLVIGWLVGWLLVFIIPTTCTAVRGRCKFVSFSSSHDSSHA